MNCFSLNVLEEFKVPEYPVKLPNKKYWQNGLLVRVPNHLGDAVMCMPAIKQLKFCVPENCALTVVCPKYMKDIFEGMEGVDYVVALEKTHKFWGLKQTIKVRQMKMCCGILFNNSLRDVIQFRLCGVKYILGAAARGRSILLSRKFKFSSNKKCVLANVHHTNRYLSMAYAMGAPKWDGIMPKINLDVWNMELSPEVVDICEHPKVLILGAGAAYGAAKRWDSEKFNKVAKYWIKHKGIVVAVGNKNEYKQCEETLNNLDDRKVYNMAGKTTIIELVCMLKKAFAVVANDSGVMHLSAALGRPGVAIFGPTDYTSTGPVNPQWSILYERQNCSPCFKRECNSRKCMNVVSPFDVIRQLRKIENKF